eukprot:CAMPEP_0116544076 /NCGR_PEP_ID=MMETSP0397-20121206/1916_1 /TAXON_ID=216820 /ORGANISM="Cyclophora tenuis, Strain ECT3854" /LENGTH=365 /DNA_ID=CAMNT_0004068247 /DNA_START=257 /DNA_END=1354 /DNA_ORIENTATION=-
MTPSNVAPMIPALQQTAENLLNRLQTSHDDEQQLWNMHEICTEFTLDVATKQIIGMTVEEDQLSVFRQALSDWIGLLFAGADTEKGWNAREFMVRKIEARIDELKENDGSALAAMVFSRDDDDDDDDADDESNTKKNKNSRRLSKDQIIENTLLLILAGSETSAGTLTLCMLLLGLKPEKYTKLVQEQESVLKQYGNALSNEALESGMPYADAVVREALRIRPIVGGSMRGTKKTVVIDGKQIPAGWNIAYDRYLTHLLDPITYQPDESNMDVKKGFQPERWLDESTKPSEFIPFGIGPRYCLGADLAMAEMKVFLATVARRLPSLQLTNPSSEDIVWKEKCIIPVPKDGVIVDASKVREPQTVA